MVEELESATRVQSSGLVQPAAPAVRASSPTNAYIEAFNDAIVLSAQARKVMVQMETGQTVAEAWLSHVLQAPDPATQGVGVGAGTATDQTGDKREQADQQSLQRATNDALNNLSWLFDAMSPPRVDMSAVAKELAARMTADAVGVAPPLPEAVSRAEQAGTTAALHISNLSVTAGGGRGTSVSIERVGIATIDPSVGQSVSGSDRPVVLDVGGEVKQLPGLPGASNPDGKADPVFKPFGTGDADKGDIPGTLGAKDNKDKAPGTGDDKAAAAADDIQRRALLIIRQGGQRQPGGTLKVSLDVLLPLN